MDRRTWLARAAQVGAAAAFGPLIGTSSGCGGGQDLDAASRGRWRSVPMGFARAGHAAVEMADGRVAVIGGEGQVPAALPREVLAFDPAHAAFSPIGELMSPRMAHSATALFDGRVLVVGAGAPDAPHGELFDPATGRSTPAPIRMARSHHTSTRLPDGRVLLIGGQGAAASSVELFDPARGSSRVWPAALGFPRRRHVAWMAPDGSVLIHGGESIDARAALPERIDPLRERLEPLPWPRVEPIGRRVGHAVVPMPDGRHCMAGGEDAFLGDATGTTLLVDANGEFTAGPSLTLRRSGHVLVPLRDGRVLAIGGLGSPTAADWVAQCEVLEPGPLPSWQPAASLAVPRVFHSANRLKDGRVLVIGGNDRRRQAVASAELFE